MSGNVAILVTAVLGSAAPASPQAAAVASVRETAGDIETLVAPARRLELRLDVSLTASLLLRSDRGEIPRGGDRAARGDRAGINLELATRPDLWYAVGVASGTEATAVEVVASDGTVTRTVTTSDQALVWSARIFKRLGPVVLSGGMVDSRAALGIELRGWQDRLRLEMLASTAHPLEVRPLGLRVGASLQWRWIYLQAGAQELADRELRAAYLGLGMRWSDPDLLRSLGWLAR